MAAAATPVESYHFDFDMSRNNSTECDPADTKSSTTSTKRRRGPLTRNACKICRIKKLKCSGEKQGCGRCRSNGLDCHYETSSSNSKKRPSIADFTPSVSPWEREDSILIERNSIMEGESDPNGLDNIGRLVFQPRSFSPFQSESIGDILSTEALDSFITSTGSQAFMKPTLNSPAASPRVDPMLFHASEWANVAAVPQDVDRRSTPLKRQRTHARGPSKQCHDWPVGSHRTRPDISGQEETLCACYSRVLLQHEDVSSNLLWSTRGTTPAPPAEMLRALKRTMEGLEALFECRVHCTRPDFVALLITICDMMLGSVEYLVPRLIGDDDSDAASAAEDSDSSSGCGSQRRTSSSRSGSVMLPPQPTLRLSQGTLDKEDELHVLHSLVRVRVKRLGLLIDRLYHAVDDNGRPIHRHTVCNLQDRLRTVSAALKRSQSG